MKTAKNQTATKIATRHYLEQVWVVKKYAIPALLLPGIGNVFTSYIPPLVVASAITRFSNQVPGLEQILPYLLLMGAIWLFGEVIWRVALFFLNRADAHAMNNLYVNAMDGLLRKDLGFFHNNFAGSLTKKAIAYGKNYESFLDTLSINVFGSFIPLLFAVFILWHYSAWLVVTLLGLMSIVFAITIPLIRRRKKLVRSREAASNVMAGHLADVIGNIDAVQAYGHEEQEKIDHRRNVSDYMRKAQASWDYHTIKIDSAISPIYVMINVIGLALAITLSETGSQLAAVFVTFNYFTRITLVLWEFNRIYKNLESSVTEAAQFTELLLADSKVQESEGAHTLTVTKGQITLRDLTFGYSDDHQMLFKHLDLDVAAGEKIALVGHSGGGKTTITKLLLRFVDVADGEVLIDGQNIAHATLNSLRSAIAYVPQEPIMFHRSIADNIRYGKLDASDEAVIHAAKQANAHEFIAALPEGYQTMVGERGVKLSGGQRQRVAIARALIKHAPILVLDEATSALDSESEKLIQAALWKLMEHRTSIIIAHRLSTIQKMDRIIVLDNGKIVEQGSHKELLDKDGVYAKLWAHQSGGFIEE